ncbi:MAG: hypothetical protein ACTTJH_01925 [Bacteroidales bacterium]
MKIIKTIILIIVLPLLFISCKPDKDDYTEGWIGRWQTTDETIFPQTKYLHSGNIVKDNEEQNKVILAGSLLGINSSYKIPIKLSSSSKGSIDYTNGFNIKGVAVFNSKDTIWLRMSIFQGNKTEYDTITLVKVQ